jgi:DNA-binding MarR family transcriptional regulator
LFENHCINFSKVVIFMQVAKYSYRAEYGIKISPKERTILSEIGLEEIPTATNFVEYLADRYGMSQGGIWYTLKKLKKEGLLDFKEKGEEYKPLALTEGGVSVLRNNASPDTRQYYVKRMHFPQASLTV